MARTRLTSTERALGTLALARYERTMLTADIDARIAALQAERAALTATVDCKIVGLEARIKANVLVLGVSVKNALIAVWNKGRVTWDDKALLGYAAANPEILQFRTENEPYVSIREAR